MKYEIFDIQNALNACRSSLKTLNISESTTTGTTAALLMHSRSSSPLIQTTTRDISTMAMASTTKLGAKQRHPIATSTGNVQGSTVRLFGTYPAGVGSPDWGWRIVLDWCDPDHFGLRMFNVLPDGTDVLAVDLHGARTP